MVTQLYFLGNGNKYNRFYHYFAHIQYIQEQIQKRS